jgi:hypothetical protein
MGSTTPSTAFAAIAASIAEPPRASTSAPACDAGVWLVATMPNFEITMERACDRSCGETGNLLIIKTPIKAPILLPKVIGYRSFSVLITAAPRR